MALERAAAELFVGRERELARLEDAFDEAAGGGGRLCLVSGEPGIGKTALLERLTARASEREAQVLWGRCWEGEGAPVFWPWIQIVRSYVEKSDAELLEGEMGAGAAHVAQIVPEVREVLRDLPELPPSDSEQARFRLFDSVTGFLRRAARSRPLVLMLDDLHWADAASLELLRFVAREVASSRLLVIAAYRDVEVQPGHPLADTLPALRREKTVERVLLRGLPREEIHALLVAFRGGEIPEQFSRLLAEETEGNPFFIVEILRHLLDEGIAYREGGQWATAGTVDQIPLPESVRDVIGRRLQRLGPECAELLTVAAVIGREFSLDLLAKVAHLESERILGLLEEVTASRIVDADPRAIGRYRFSHALIRETLYDRVKIIDRVRLHRRVGEAIESLAGVEVDSRLEELAHHFLASLPGGDVERAVDYAVRAARLAVRQLAWDHAARRYEGALRALELLQPPEDRRRCDLLLSLGETLSVAYGTARSRDVFSEAALLAERLADAERLARAALGVAGVGSLFESEANPETVRLLEKALERLGGDDTPLRALVTAQLAAALTYSPRREQGMERARSAIAMARRIGDPGVLARVLNQVHITLWEPDNLDDRLERATEILRLAESIGDVRTAVQSRWWRVSDLLEIGEIDAARGEIEAVQRLAAEFPVPFVRWVSALLQATYAFLEGRLDDVERFAGQALEAAGGGPGAQLVYAGQITLLRSQQGRLAEFTDSLREIADRSPGLPGLRVVLAWIYAEIGREEEARAELARVSSQGFDQFPRDMNWMSLIWNLAEVVVALQDRERAKEIYDILLPYATRILSVGGLSFRGSLSRSLGGLATVLGLFDDAERHFEEALATNRRTGAALWTARTQCDLASMLLTRASPGDRERAIGLFEDANAEATARGFVAIGRKLDALARKHGLAIDGELAPPAPGPSPDRSAGCVFRQEGDVWALSWEGKGFRLRDNKGMRYIARLLARPGQELHVADLAADPTAGPGGSGTRDEGVASSLGDAGDVLDPQARSQYKARIESLRFELTEAEGFNDTGRASRLREEIDFLARELSAAVGLGGRSRKSADHTERARKAVTNRIREAIRRIREQHEPLGLHLENGIRTGSFCVYQPERPIDWVL